MNVLVLNAGSSSLKFSLLDAVTEATLDDGSIDQPADIAAGVKSAIGQVRQSGRPIDAVAHRVVHGGTRFTQAVRVLPEVKRAIADLDELAPLHNPPGLKAIEAAEAELPGVPHVACFDTAFHATLPPEAFTYPVPHQWTAEWGVRRFGFHGLSHAYCSRRAAEMLGPAGRIVVAHLGNGCSLAAVRDGRSVDTTMGFTPLDGLMMGTRSGSVDPGVLSYVQAKHGLTAGQVDHALNHESGLLGVSGVSSDLRRVKDASRAGNARAELALDIFIHRVAQGVAAMTASLGGLDALVFTAGIGEHAKGIRAAVCERLGFLGLAIDAAKNTGCKPDADVSADAATVRVLVIHTREDVTAVREVASLLK
jgi:acetate kinase